MVAKDTTKTPSPKLATDALPDVALNQAQSSPSQQQPEAPQYRSIKDEATFSHILPKPVDLETEQEGVYHWEIMDWKSLESKTKSPPFQVGEFSWRILLFPKGNNQGDFVSVYLEAADPMEHGHKENWHTCAQFSLVISHPQDPTNFYSNNADHRFTQEEVDWGFTRFYDVKQLQQPSKEGKGPFLVNNQATISVFVRVLKDETGVLWHNFVNYDSKKETGYVGMKNQGATCYMNSLLQSLYCTNLFRKAVYQIPTENDEPTNSVALALQRCFYNLQYEDSPIGTTELTKSFGWDSVEAFMQHDVQEFNRVLQDNLEVKMKGTPADGAISNLFVGKMKSYVKCINVDYESSRVEDFYDIQLNVKGCKTLQDSFKEYVAMETLEGENKYQAEGFGFQDANKGVIFESLPPVLHLQLKRFEYDFMRDTMVKINDRHEFPEEINLDEFVSKDTDRKEPYDYVLHGVLVHSGDLHSGHYFALIKAEKEGKWLRFDDDRVTPVTRKEVFEENFGDDTQTSPGGGNLALVNGGVARTNNSRLMKRYTNAYMLVYIQKSKLNNVLSPVAESDIPHHLKRRISEERAAIEKRKKDKEEMHLYANVAVITDTTFKDRQEFDLATFDDRAIQTTPGVDVFKVLKTDTVASFKDKLVDHYKLENDDVRLWNVIYRTNETVRVDTPFTPIEEQETLDKLRGNSNTSLQMNGFAKLYLETIKSPAKLPEIKSDVLLVFIKYFDVQQQTIRGLGHLFIKSNDKVGDIIPTLNKLSGLPQTSVIDLYEEVNPSMIDKMNPKQTFKQSEIQNGDIICFQLPVLEEKTKELRDSGKHATVKDHYESIFNRVMVTFKSKLDRREGNEIKIVLDRRARYSQIAHQLADKLGVEWTKIRLTAAHATTQQPKEVIPFQSQLHLHQMALGMARPQDYVHAVNLDDILPQPVLFYEILDVSMADLESRKSLQVTLLGPGGLREETTTTVFVPTIGTVADIIPVLEQKKCKLDLSRPDLLRFYEIMDGKITKEFSLDQPIDNVGDKRTSTLYIERIPEDELEMDMDNDRLIQVVHYSKDPSRLHSVPFRFTVKKNETFDETRKRLQQRLGYGNKEWQKVKFNVIKNINAPEPDTTLLDKDDIVLRDIRIGEDDALGLEHQDKAAKNGRFGGAFERGIFIRG